MSAESESRFATTEYAHPGFARMGHPVGGDYWEKLESDLI